MYKHGAEIPLTALEYRLLLIFANHIGQVLTRNQLLEQIWDVAGDFVNDNTLTVYIKGCGKSWRINRSVRRSSKPSAVWAIRLVIRCCGTGRFKFCC